MTDRTQPERDWPVSFGFLLTVMHFSENQKNTSNDRNRYESFAEPVRENRQDELDRWRDTLRGDRACQREWEILWNRCGNPSEPVRTNRQDELDSWKDTLGGDCVNSIWKSQRNHFEIRSETVRKNRQDELDQWRDAVW